MIGSDSRRDGALASLVAVCAVEGGAEGRCVVTGEVLVGGKRGGAAGGDAGHGVLVAGGFGWRFVGEVRRCICVLLLLLLGGVFEVCEFLHP